MALSQCLRNISEVQTFYLNRIKNFNFSSTITSTYIKIKIQTEIEASAFY